MQAGNQCNRARGQISFPTFMRAGACFGFSAMGYQNWEVANGVFEANNII